MKPQEWRAQGEATPDFETPLTHPRTLRYNADTRGLISHPSINGPWGPWIAELARFPVPYGSIGFVSDFAQFLADSEIVFSSVSRWGDFRLPFDVRWVLRLVPFTGRVPPWIVSTVPITWPGAPYPDCPEETDLWFPVHAKEGVRWTVPGGYMLRVFADIGTWSDRLTVAAKLRGLTQMAYSCEASRNLRTVW